MMAASVPLSTLATSWRCSVLDTNIFYTEQASRLLSYNAMWHAVVGERGVGKTFWGIEYGVKRFLKYGEQFIYLRRTIEELKTVSATTFDAVIHAGKFPEHDFRVLTIEGQRLGQIAPQSTRDEKKRPWQTVCFFMGLSAYQKYKSINYPRVHSMFYDEFIKESSNMTHYLPNEYKALTSLYQTVDRNQDRVKLFMFGNAVSIMNPVFTELGVNADEVNEYSTYGKDRDGQPFFVLHVTDSVAFKQHVGKSRFSQFIAGTAYGEFAQGNVFADSHDELIKRKTPKAKYRYSLETERGSFAIWHDIYEKLVFVDTKHTKTPRWFTLVVTEMNDTKKLVTVNDEVLGSLRTAFRHGRAYFDRASTRNAFMEVFKS